MDPSDKSRLRTNLTVLAENVRIQDVMPYLLQDDVCTYNDKEEIEAEKTSRDQVLKLVEILQKKGPTAYPALCRALTTTGSEYIVDRMTSCMIEDAREKIQACPPSLLSLIQEELREFYTRQLRHLSPIPWSDVTQLSLEKCFTSMQLVHGASKQKFFRSSSQTESSNNNILSMQEMFMATPMSPTVRKVLVEGEPGIGKTTMASKMAYDWAQGTNNSGVENFCLVFLLRANDLDEDDTLQDLLLKHLLPEDFTCQNITDCLKEHQQQTLFIIDGFDEIQQEHSHILKLIQSKIFSKSHVLVTARPHFMSRNLKCFDLVLLNIGYSAHQQIEFATKFMEDIVGEQATELYGDFLQKLHNDELMKDLCRNPLHLSILCMLQIEHGKDVPTSRSALYEQMHSFIMRRASSKTGLTFEKFMTACRPLYKIAYQGLLEGRHQVTQEEILQHIDVQTVEHACFIVKEIQVSHFCPRVTYSFIHKSFQEYFAAGYIAGKARKERVQLLRQIKHKSPYHMVTSFLCGLLKDDVSLKDVLDVVSEEVYLPKNSEVTMGVQFISENHNSHLILHCFSELSQTSELTNILSDKLEIGHTCFSLLWCKESCVDGMISYLRALDSACSCDGRACPKAIKITMQMQCLDQRTGLYEKLLQAVCSFRHAGHLHVHNFTSTSQLVLLFSKLKEVAGRCLHTLELHMLNVEDFILSAEEMKSFTWILFSLKSLNVIECSSAGLLTQLLSLIKPCNQLESLEIMQSALDKATCKQLCITLESTVKLTAFHFHHNSIHNEPEFYMEMLNIICTRKNLAKLTLSHLPTKRMLERRVSIKPLTQDSTVHMFPSLSRSLQSSQLTMLAICNTSLGEDILMSLKDAISANHQLQHLQLRDNYITSFRALDDVLDSIADLPTFETLSLRGTNLDEANIQQVVDLISKSQSLKYLCIPAWLGSLDYLAAGLHKNSSLTVLEVRNLQFHDLKVKVFAEAIAKHGCLRQLNVGSNCAAPVDMQELIKACTINQNLRKLMFVNFGLDSTHVKCIGEMLASNQNITSLDIRGNSFSLSDLAVLHEYLTKRPKLKFLNVTQSLAKNWDPVVDQLKERVVMLKAEWF